MNRRISLVELSVVLFVLLVLVSIFVPLFTKVKAYSQGVNCVSQLRALGMAFSLYTIDNHNFLPHQDDGSDAPPSGFIWYKKVMPYLTSEDAEGMKYRQEVGFEYDGQDITNTVFSYKMNSHLEDYKGTKTFTSAPFRELSTVTYPSRTVLIFDGRTDKAPYNFQPFGMFTSVHARHSGKAAILFLDWTCKLLEGNNQENEFWKDANNLIWDPDTDY